LPSMYGGGNTKWKQRKKRGQPGLQKGEKEKSAQGDRTSERCAIVVDHLEKFEGAQ